MSAKAPAGKKEFSFGLRREREEFRGADIEIMSFENDPKPTSTSLVEEKAADVAPTSAVKLREARFDDYEQIAAVQKRNDLAPKTREQWMHLWQANPAYQKAAAWPIGWVAETAEQRVVGYMGNVPANYSFQGRELLASGAHAMAMDQQYRGHAGFLLKRLLAQKSADLVLTTTANPNSSRLCEPLRCLRVPNGNWGRSVYWITGHRGFLASALQMKGYPKAMAYPVALGLAVRDTIRHKAVRSSAQDPSFTVCPGFDSRFDTFWQELKAVHPNRLLADRSADVLQWHFKFSLEQGNVWILTAGTPERITSYAIFYRHDNPKISLKRVRLIDFQTIDGNNEILAPMIRWAYQRCREEGIHMLEAYGFRQEKERIIEGLSPHHRQLPSWFYFYKTRDRALLEALADPNVWDPCHYDGDSSL